MTNPPRGIRLRKDDDLEIMKIVEAEETSFSTVITKIVHNWLIFQKSKQERGDITMASEIIKNYFNSIKKTDISKLVEANAKYIISEIKLQTDNLDFEELCKRITQWNYGNGLILKNRKQENRNGIIFWQNHYMGIVWSEIQCKIYSKMFELIKETIINQKFDKFSFSFEVIKNNRT